MKSLPSIVAQTWPHLRRFPTSDALANAVMLQAIYALIWAPFETRKFFVLTRQPFFSQWRRWNFLFWPLFAVAKTARLSRSFDLSLRLRHDDQKAWRTAIIGSFWGLMWTVVLLYFHVQIKKGPRELTKKQREWMTVEEAERHELNRQKALEKPWKPFLSPIQCGFLAVSVALALNVLRCALPKSTRARFASDTS